VTTPTPQLQTESVRPAAQHLTDRSPSNIGPGHPLHEYTAKREMRLLALKGATADQLTSFAEKVGYHPAVASLWAGGIIVAARPQREAIATALAGYPHNNIRPPRIVNAAPFAARPSIYTRKDTTA
jgi:hypothetical protein